MTDILQEGVAIGFYTDETLRMGAVFPNEILLKGIDPKDRLIELCKILHGSPVFTQNFYGKDILCRVDLPGIISEIRYIQSPGSLTYAQNVVCERLLNRLGFPSGSASVNVKDPFNTFFKCDKGGTFGPIGSVTTVQTAVNALSDIMTTPRDNGEFVLDPGTDEYLEEPTKSWAEVVGRCKKTLDV